MSKTQEIGQPTIEVFLGKKETRLVSAKYRNRPRPTTIIKTEAVIPDDFKASFALRKIAVDDIINDAIALYAKLNNIQIKLDEKNDPKEYFIENLGVGTTYCNIKIIIENNRRTLQTTVYQKSVVARRSVFLPLL